MSGCPLCRGDLSLKQLGEVYRHLRHLNRFAGRCDVAAGCSAILRDIFTAVNGTARGGRGDVGATPGFGVPGRTSEDIIGQETTVAQCDSLLFGACSGYRRVGRVVAGQRTEPFAGRPIGRQRAHRRRCCAAVSDGKTLRW
jgi:hypothetical protein